MVETSPTIERQNTFPSQAELIHSGEIPIFTKDDIKLQDVFHWTQLFARLRGTHRPRPELRSGVEKKVISVLVTIDGKEVPAVLRLVRPIPDPRLSIPYPERVKRNVEDQKYGPVLQTEEQRGELAKKEYADLFLLNSLHPANFPRPLGVYQHGRHKGVVVEQVIGSKLGSKGIWGGFISDKQFLQFNDAIEDLIRQEIFVYPECLYYYNLMIGRTASNPTESIMVVDAEIITKNNAELLRIELDRLENYVGTWNYQYRLRKKPDSDAS